MNVEIPSPPAPPELVEPAHTCAGWIQVTKGTRPVCERCVERLEAYRSRASGHGTIDEIREAISALENLRGRVPLGETVRVDLQGLRVWACPRSVNVGEGDDVTPLVDVAMNRRERRSMKRRR